MPITLAQSIEDLALKAGTFDRPNGPVLEPLLAAIDTVARARARLHGLEEANAITAAREHALERALELKARVDPLDIDIKLLDLATFLAPGFEELDGLRPPSDDPFGPTDTLDELEGKLTEAEETVLAQRDRIADLITERDAAVDRLEREVEIQRNYIAEADTAVAFMGEVFGRLPAENARRLSNAIQDELNRLRAAAQVADGSRRTAEGQARAAEAELERLKGADVELGASITIRNLEDDVTTLTADKERALDVIRGHVADAETQRNAYDTLVEIADDRRRALEAAEGRVAELEGILGQSNDERRAAAIARVAELEDELELERQHPSSVTDELEGKLGRAIAERDEAQAGYDRLAKANAERIIPEGSADLMALQHHLGINPPLHLPNVDDVDTMNIAGVGLHGDRVAFVLWGRELERDQALVTAAFIVALVDRDSRFAAIVRKVFSE